MSGIIPIPTTRVGDLFVRQRLVGQVQSDQLDLFRLQNQISTGKRLQLPSDDAPAALRAINLQRLLDRKGQIKTNLQASNSYLSAAESSLDAVSALLIKLKAETVGVSGTLSNDADRRTIVQQIDQALETLVATGNTKTQGRHLFAGSRSQDQPYDFNGQYVEYSGNEGVLRSYVDLERLFETNLAGTEVFGGISGQVQGVELSPHVAADTLLSTINGGNGVSRNGAISISVNTGPSTVTSIVDLSKAVTLGDVARLIEQGAPAGTEIVADVTGIGLSLSTTSGTISVGEVAQGHAARELGILTEAGAPASNTLQGEPLTAAVLKTTQLSALLGAKAQGRIESTNLNNDIVLTATQNGAAFNDVRVIFMDDATAGSESAVYDDSNPLDKTLTVHVQGGFTTATTAAAVITAEGTFTATVDYHDATATSQAGTNPVDVGDFGQLTSGGSGEVLDADSGLIITNGDKSVTFDTSTAETVEDLLNLINGAGLGVVAEINADRDGINVRSRLSGADLTIGENGGILATQLGIRSYTGDTELGALNRGIGVPTTDKQLDTSTLDELRIVARDGTAFVADLTTATSLEDVVDLINSAPGNFAGTTAVLARLTANHNGVELVDSSTTATPGDLQINVVGATKAAEYLGFVPPGATQQGSHATDSLGNYVLSGSNVVGHDLRIVARDGTELWVSLAGAQTIQDVMDRINSDPANSGMPPKIVAGLAAVGNGIELIDSTVGAGSLTVYALEDSQAAQYLGFVAAGETQSNPNDVQNVGLTQVLKSEDRNTIEADSVFNTLLRLKTALEQNNVEEIGRSIETLDTDINRVNFARSEIGSRLQSLEVIGTRLEDENVQLRSALSQDIDVDLVEAISNLTARQYAFEASLRTTASILQLSLLNFL